MSGSVTQRITSATTARNGGILPEHTLRSHLPLEWVHRSTLADRSPPMQPIQRGALRLRAGPPEQARQEQKHTQTLDESLYGNQLFLLWRQRVFSIALVRATGRYKTHHTV
jgi:hypothetical protein